MKKIFFIAMLALVALSCGSRKRTLEKSESKLEYHAETDTAAHTVVKNNIVERADSNESSAFETQENGVDVGTGGKAVIEEFDAAGNVKKRTTIENNGSTKQSRRKALSKKETFAEKTDQTTTDIRAEGKRTVRVKAASENKSVAVDRKGVSWSWLWILLLIIVIAVVCYLRNKIKAV